MDESQISLPVPPIVLSEYPDVRLVPYSIEVRE